MSDIHSLVTALTNLNQKVSCLSDLIDGVVGGACCTFALTELSPPIDEPALGHANVLFNKDTNELWGWNGSSWVLINYVHGIYDVLSVGQVLATSGFIDLGGNALYITNGGDNIIFETSGGNINLNTDEAVQLGDLTNANGGLKFILLNNNIDSFIDNTAHNVNFGINTITPSVALDVVGEVTVLGETIDTTPVRVNVLSDASLQFDKRGGPADSVALDVLTVLQQQTGQGNVPFGISISRTPNANGARDNHVIHFGWNVGTQAVVGQPGIEWQIEDWYQPTVGNDYSELHLVLRDKLGVEHRVDTWSLDHDVPANHVNAKQVTAFEVRNPADNSPYFKVDNVTTNGAFLRVTGSGTNKGLFITVDVGANQASIGNQGLTSPELILTSFAYTEVARLQITTGKGDGSNKLWGESAGGWHEKITVGTTLDLATDILNLKAVAGVAGVHANPTSITVDAYGRITAIS